MWAPSICYRVLLPLIDVTDTPAAMFGTHGTVVSLLVASVYLVKRLLEYREIKIAIALAEALRQNGCAGSQYSICLRTRNLYMSLREPLGSSGSVESPSHLAA